MHILDFVDDIKYFKSAVNLWTLIGEVWSVVNFVIRNDPSQAEFAVNDVGFDAREVTVSSTGWALSFNYDLVYQVAPLLSHQMLRCLLQLNLA